MWQVLEIFKNISFRFFYPLQNEITFHSSFSCEIYLSVQRIDLQTFFLVWIDYWMSRKFQLVYRRQQIIAWFSNLTVKRLWRHRTSGENEFLLSLRAVFCKTCTEETCFLGGSTNTLFDWNMNHLWIDR